MVPLNRLVVVLVLVALIASAFQPIVAQPKQATSTVEANKDKSAATVSV